ncbi:MAG: type II toxin-antitoxin system RelE/ParE family toxin [Bacilli bacterium]|nr:type II toxin-antitoxin system RelE/ParE family toxin [Bacilli bacterium]
MKEVKVIFEGDAKEEYIKLNFIVEEEIKKGVNKSENQTLLKSIHSKIELLKNNPQAGRAVKKSLIPSKYLKKDITNLWILNLSNYWRLLYNIQTDEVVIFCFVLEYGDHNRYNDLFGFKKK